MSFMFNVRYAMRNLLKSYGFTLSTVLVMAIGLGASIFAICVVRQLLWEPIYFPEGERVIDIKRRVNNEWRQTRLHDMQKVKESVTSVELVAGYNNRNAVISDGYRSVRYQATMVAGDFFKITGVSPLLGRVLNAQDQRPGALNVVVLSYQLWQNHFSARSDIIGQKIDINGSPMEVVGVATANSAHPLRKTLWLPIQKKPTQIALEESPGLASVIARLKPGITVLQAREEINRVFANSPELVSGPQQKLSALVFDKKRSYFPGIVNIFYAMFAAALCVLILCCINVGNLLLARCNEKIKHAAIRLALGAPRSSLVLQVMWEAVIICLLGGVLGVLLAGWALDISDGYIQKRYQVTDFPRYAEISFQGIDVLVGLAFTVVTIFITAFTPAWQISKCHFNNVLKDGAKTSLGKKAGRITQFLVATQIGLSCSIMIAAGVLFTVIHQGISRGHGVDISRFVYGQVHLAWRGYPDNAAIQAYFEQWLANAKQTPGVEQATVVSSVPTEWSWALNVEPEGLGWGYSDFIRTNQISIYPNALAAFDMPLLQGRGFNISDRADSQPVVVISELLANKLWPNESPLGKRLRGYYGSKKQAETWRTVVGVVPQITHRELFDEQTTANLYVPFSQDIRRNMALVLKTSGEPMQLAASLAEITHKMDANTPIFHVTSMLDKAKSNRAAIDFIKQVFLIFAIAALIMAATGIYGMMTNHVQRRTQEIGIRRALGIPKAAIIRLLMRQSFIHLAAGFAVGIPLGYSIAALFVVRFSSGGQLHQLVYVLVPLIIASVVILATLFPLFSVLRQAPSTALRYE